MYELELSETFLHLSFLQSPGITETINRIASKCWLWVPPNSPNSPQFPFSLRETRRQRGQRIYHKVRSCQAGISPTRHTPPHWWLVSCTSNTHPSHSCGFTPLNYIGMPKFLPPTTNYLHGTHCLAYSSLHCPECQVWYCTHRVLCNIDFEIKSHHLLCCSAGET